MRKRGLLTSMAIVQLIGSLVIAQLVLASIHLEISIVHLQTRTVMYHQLFIHSHSGSFPVTEEYRLFKDDNRVCISWENFYMETEELCL